MEPEHRFGGGADLVAAKHADHHRSSRRPQRRTHDPGPGSSPAGGERLFDGHARCSRRRLRRPLHPVPCPQTAIRSRLGARDQPRRLPADRARGRRDFRLFTRRGYDWTGRYPAIASAASKIRAQSFTLDGEAVVCGEDGVAIFDALHRHGTVRAAILQAFDLLELNGEDFRPQPLSSARRAWRGSWLVCRRGSRSTSTRT
jgi:hypothetical protein